MLAEMHDRVGTEPAVCRRRGEPPIRGQVVMAGGQIRVVIDRDRVLPEAPWRLDHQRDVAQQQAGQHDVGAVDVQRAWRLTPMLADLGLELFGQCLEVPQIVGQRDSRGRGGQLGLGQPLDVVATRGDEPVDQRVRILGDGTAHVYP